MAGHTALDFEPENELAREFAEQMMEFLTDGTNTAAIAYMAGVVTGILEDIGRLRMEVNDGHHEH